MTCLESAADTAYARLASQGDLAKADRLAQAIQGLSQTARRQVEALAAHNGMESTVSALMGGLLEGV